MILLLFVFQTINLISRLEKFSANISEFTELKPMKLLEIFMKAQIKSDVATTHHESDEPARSSACSVTDNLTKHLIKNESQANMKNTQKQILKHNHPLQKAERDEKKFNQNELADLSKINSIPEEDAIGKKNELCQRKLNLHILNLLLSPKKLEQLDTDERKEKFVYLVFEKIGNFIFFVII